MKCIAYKGGYKYQLDEEYRDTITIHPVEDVCSPGDFVTLSKEGELVLKKGYAWDGATDPAPDTSNIMRGSLVHDALYQLMREEVLNKDSFRDQADRLLQQICKDDGMNPFFAWIVYQAVRICGGSAADPSSKKIVIKAPKACG